MGGYGSGRWGGRPAVENSLTLDLSHLFKTGWLKAGASTTGTLRWSIAGSTGQIASVDFESCLGEESGGRRWWFICPRTGRLASRLHLPPGAYSFACRRAYEPGYLSQRQMPRDRAVSRVFTLRRRLGNNGGIGSYVAKPKGKHWRLFERALMKIAQAEVIVQGHAARLLPR